MYIDIGPYFYHLVGPRKNGDIKNNKKKKNTLKTEYVNKYFR